MVKILYVAMKYDYGKPEQGYSFEHYNFYETLRRMGYDILYLDFVTLMRQRGRRWLNRRLLDVVKEEKPELMFTVLFTNELDPAVIREVSENTETITLNWFCDDHWRFETFSRHWAPCFNWVVTTSKLALPKYAELGYRNAIKSQWACNHFVYCHDTGPLEYGVTFVGQPHSDRRQTIQTLRRAGIGVQVWGTGWESGRLTHEQMVRVFSRSRINLNLSGASERVSTPELRGAKTVYGRNGRSSHAMQEELSLTGRVKRWLAFASGGHSHPNIQTGLAVHGDAHLAQIKARNFEVPGCGGFLLTEYAEDLERYYAIGREVVCFEGVDSLVECIRYYLRQEDERAAIARAAYERTLREHTYVHRLTDIFRQIGLLDEALSGAESETQSHWGATEYL